MSKKVQVQFIRSFGENALVEHTGESGRVRVIVPRKTLIRDLGNFYLEQEQLDYGIEYGIPWEEELKDIKILATKVAENLRNNDVWTAEDARQKPEAVNGAVFAATKEMLMQVSSVVREYHRKEQGV